MKNNNYKVTDSIINHVVVKRFNESTDDFDVVHTVDGLPFNVFIDYLDNLTTIAAVHWSVDYLNLEYTRATVYVTF